MTLTASTSTRATRWPRERLAVSGAFLANGFVLGNWTPQIPIFRDRLGLSESQLGLLILAFGIGAVLAMPLVGAATARLGTRRPVIGGQVLLALAFPLLAFAPGSAAAALAILVFGMTMGGMDVAMNANAVAVERRLPRAMMSSCHGFWSIGGFIGAAVGGPLIALLGPTGHMVLVGLLVLVAVWPVGRAMLEDRDAPLEDHSGEAGDAGGRRRLFSFGALAIGLGALFAMVPEGAAIDWSAIYLRQDHGVEVSLSGLAFAALSGSMALFRFLGDPIRDRLGAVRTVRVSVVLGIVGLLLVALGTGLPLILAGFAVLGVGLSNIVPVAFSAAGNIPGLKPGVGISVATTIGYSGILVAPSAIGWFAEHFGFPPVFLGLAVLLALVFPLAGLMRGADRVRSEPSPTEAR